MVVEYVDKTLEKAVLIIKFELLELFFLENIPTGYHYIHRRLITDLDMIDINPDIRLSTKMYL